MNCNKKPSIDPKIEAVKRAEQFVEKPEDRTLCEVDDFVRYSLLDHIMGFPSSKSFPNHKRVPSDVQMRIAEYLKVHTFFPESNDALDTIYGILSLYFLDPRLEMIIENYLSLFDHRSGVTVARCDKYTLEGKVGMKLIATRNLAPKEILSLYNLSTTIIEKWPMLNDYSCTSSSMKIEEKLWLGPMAFCNHSCSANSIYRTLDKGQQVIEITKPIKIGEEIFLNYGPNYFRKNCECEICKKRDEKSADNQPETSRAKRSSAIRINYNLEKHITPAENKDDIMKRFGIYKQMFRGINYPEAVRKQCELQEQDDMLSQGIISSGEIFSKMERVTTTVNDVNDILNQKFSLLELDDSDKNVVKDVIEIMAQCCKMLSDVTQTSSSSDVDDCLKNKKNSLGNMKKMSESMMSTLQSYSKHVFEAVLRENEFKKRVEVKERKQKEKIEEKIVKGNGKTLEQELGERNNNIEDSHGPPNRHDEPVMPSDQSESPGAPPNNPEKLKVSPSGPNGPLMPVNGSEEPGKPPNEPEESVAPPDDTEEDVPQVPSKMRRLCLSPDEFVPIPVSPERNPHEIDEVFEHQKAPPPPRGRKNAQRRKNKEKPAITGKKLKSYNIQIKGVENSDQNTSITVDLFQEGSFATINSGSLKTEGDPKKKAEQLQESMTVLQALLAAFNKEHSKLMDAVPLNPPNNNE